MNVQSTRGIVANTLMTGVIIMKSLFEQDGGTYSFIGDYHLPNLTVPKKTNYAIGIWGRKRSQYLKHHKRITYINLLTSCELYEHLADIEQKAQEFSNELVYDMASKQGITEKLKTQNQMEWIGKMNNIRYCAEEIVLARIVYI